MHTKDTINYEVIRERLKKDGRFTLSINELPQDVTFSVTKKPMKIAKDMPKPTAEEISKEIDALVEGIKAFIAAI